MFSAVSSLRPASPAALDTAGALDCAPRIAAWIPKKTVNAANRIPDGRMRRTMKGTPTSYDTTRTAILTPALNLRGYRLHHVRGVRLASEIRRPHPATGDDALDARHDPVVQFLMAEVSEHQRAGPDRADWVCDAFAGDVWRRTVNRFEHRRVFALGVDVGTGRDAKAARHR